METAAESRPISQVACPKYQPHHSNLVNLRTALTSSFTLSFLYPPILFNECISPSMPRQKLTKATQMPPILSGSTAPFLRTSMIGALKVDIAVVERFGLVMQELKNRKGGRRNVLVESSSCGRRRSRRTRSDSANDDLTVIKFANTVTPLKGGAKHRSPIYQDLTPNHSAMKQTVIQTTRPRIKFKETWLTPSPQKACMTPQVPIKPPFKQRDSWIKHAATFKADEAERPKLKATPRLVHRKSWLDSNMVSVDHETPKSMELTSSLPVVKSSTIIQHFTDPMNATRRDSAVSCQTQHHANPPTVTPTSRKRSREWPEEQGRVAKLRKIFATDSLPMGMLMPLGLQRGAGTV